MKSIVVMAGLAALMMCSPASMVAQQVATEMPDSINNIFTLAKKGDAKAQNEVGAMYYKGQYVKQDYEEALQWWARAAKQGEVKAIGNMGVCYRLGHGIAQDSLKSIQLYAKSIKDGNKALFEQNIKLAENNDVFASVLLGYCYQKGVGTKKDGNKMVGYFKKAANLNSVDAQRELALCYLNAQHPEEAIVWFKRGADNGDLPSTFYSGKLLLEGKGVKQDKQQGAIYLLKAAEAGFPQAQYEVANCYASGEGLMKNLEQAVVWYKKAASNGVSNGQWKLALCYVNGEGVERNYHEAIYWFGEALPKGHTRAFKKLFEEGENSIKGTPFMTYLQGMSLYTMANNYEKALDCFKEVEKAKITEGKTMRAVCMLNEKYEKYHLKKGTKALKEAAESDAVAMYLLGIMYEAGKGLDKDVEQALSYLNSSAKKGYATAQCYLGDMYYEGRGVEQDYIKAVEYYSQAENQGQLTANAAKRFASCYENGWGGLEVDKKKAESLLEQEQKDNVEALLKLVPME